MENRKPRTEMIPICDIRQSFRSARWVYADQIAVVEKDMIAKVATLVRPSFPNEELSNWEIVELPMILDSFSM